MSDLISRQAAIEALKRAEALTRAFGYHNVIETIRDLPTAEKKGRWYSIGNTGIAACKCGFITDRYSAYNYCPNCGVSMMDGGEE